MKHSPALILSALLAAQAGAAMAAAGLTGAPVLNTPIGARSSALGRAFTAVPGDAEAINYNPGALAFTSSANVSATYMSGFFGGSYGFLAAPVPLGTFTLTPAYLFYNSGTMNLNLSDGTKATVTAEEDKAGYLSAGWRPVPRLGVGATVKRVSTNLAQSASASSTHYDFGILYAAGNGLSFGASYLNSGGEIKFETNGDPPPRTKRLGASYKFDAAPPSLSDPDSSITRCDVLLSADWSRTDKEKSYIQAGLESDMTLWNGSVFTPRLGYLAGRSVGGVTLGLGLAWRNWTFACSFAPSAALETVSQATVGYKF